MGKGKTTWAQIAGFCVLVKMADRFNQLAVLGYSCAHDGFAFNFTSSPAGRKIISDFIASNVKVSADC